MQYKYAKIRCVTKASYPSRNATTLLVSMPDLDRGNRIKALREERHLTQPALAERIGVTLRAYQEWEAGGGIRWMNAKRLASALCSTPDYVMSGPTPEPEPAELSQLDRIEDELRLLRAESAARDAEVLARIEALAQTIRASQRSRPR